MTHTPTPLRKDGSCIKPAASGSEWHEAWFVSESGDHPTLYVSSLCATTGDVVQFEHTANRVMLSYNLHDELVAALEGLIDATHAIPVQLRPVLFARMLGDDVLLKARQEVAS